MMQKKENTAVQKIREIRGGMTDSRREIAMLSAIGLLDFIPISFYQLGIIRHLPDFRAKVFDSDKINASKEAQIIGLPDGPVSLLMYATNLLLVGAAIKQNKRKNVFDYLIAANSIGQAAGGAYYLYNMITVQKKICLYCVTGALVNFATLIPLKKLFSNEKTS